MFKKILASSAVAVSALGMGAAMAPQAMALNNDSTGAVNGNGASQTYGNMATHGDMSPQIGLIQGSLNKPCLALPAKANLGSLVGLVPIAVQDIPILSAPQTQTCVENSSQNKGDEPLSHILDEIPILSANGAAN
ncbi:rodlin [Streptomyces sp. NBC_01264]|uniref:rodlin n=1 Tax=Streptomyces sp. NBC_01264 TaxID=2903804 RepID=UPI00224F7713|nr:rodlin [Streptomyces sp. NBC_01264]MCX4784513.1 rodlin [Streptomyces sp. NBC_01264]